MDIMSWTPDGYVDQAKPVALQRLCLLQIFSLLIVARNSGSDDMECDMHLFTVSGPETPSCFTSSSFYNDVITPCLSCARGCETRTDASRKLLLFSVQ
ncbi:hypothetical protein F0562_005173 [Nyssa sinensis]|uniref:Uncharacterized protein n=1 Tax=Nyssa sinensis TaxID=561372 RepID=A0A5J5AJK0_9ASTE|nr:hypothetical protein F0562_005173 [Nyssa sinensis]